MLDLKTHILVNVAPLLENSPNDIIPINVSGAEFFRNLAYYVNKNMAGCRVYEPKFLEFKNHEDLMRFYLTFDENDFYDQYDYITKARHDGALDQLMKEANKLT